MSTIQITDTFGAFADLQISDNSPLAKAGLTHLLSTAKALIGDLGKPVNQSDISSVSLGATLSTPSALADNNPGISVNVGVNCGLNVLTPDDKLLFPHDEFSADIPIANNQCWISFELDANLSAGVTATADGFGVAIHGGTALALTSWTLIQQTAGTFPTLKDAIISALGNFSASVNVQSILQQLAGTVHVADLSGTVSVAGSYEIPLNLNAFASADLPFNFKLSVAPSVTVKLTGSLCITGDLIVRSYKVSDSLLHLGIYKKKGSTLTATLTAGAGIGLFSGSSDTDLLAAVLNAVLPGVDVSKSGIPSDTAKALNGVIKNSLNRSLSASINASCSAATTNEAAVLYEIQLNQGDASKTSAAIQSALHGDWTALDYLGNAKRLRNILVETKERKQSLSLNLLGFYNATSVADYVSKCTILSDDSGQLTIVDSQSATRIAATSTPYASDSNKLRQALAQDFITTASYAVVGSKLNASLSIAQDFFDYANTMNTQQMRDNLLLGTALGLFPIATLNQILAGNNAFSHASISASLKYNNAAVLSIFFSNPTARTARTHAELENTGRKVMISLLDPNESTNSARISILQNDVAWAAMDSSGNVNAFNQIPELRHLRPNELADVTVDWRSIVWWADSVTKVAPVLAATLATLDKPSTADPTQDPNFMRERQTLASTLGTVTRDTKAAFVSTWGPAVIFALSGQQASAQMDITWDSHTEHFQR